MLGPTGIWTQVKGFKVLCTNHYTIGPGWESASTGNRTQSTTLEGSHFTIKLLMLLGGRMRQLGIEPRAQPWQGRIWPLNYWRFSRGIDGGVFKLFCWELLFAFLISVWKRLPRRRLRWFLTGVQYDNISALPCTFVTMLSFVRGF